MAELDLFELADLVGNALLQLGRFDLTRSQRDIRVVDTDTLAEELEPAP